MSDEKQFTDPVATARAEGTTESVGMSMTEETRSEKSAGLPYLHMALVGVLFLLLMLIKFEDPVPTWRTPLMIVLGVALPVSALLLGGRTLKKN